jgi:fused signal recognition particle receptor
MVVGVNGVGKTTTIGKLAKQFTDQGKKVVLGAADTFRAAAAEQLEVWGKRSGADVIRHQEGADPGAVAYDAVKAAVARQADVLILDTAGRLHTKVNLMEELKKIRRIAEREVAGAPHETLLVLDATTGQNALIQAKMFQQAVEVSGIALTKLDGTAKGGIVVAISSQLDLPVRLIGVGEGVADLRPFKADEFVAALFANN